MNIFQHLVFFLDAFIAYANFFYGKEMAKKIYVYYMDNSEVVSTNIKYHSIGTGEFFNETRHIIQMIESNLLKEKESIFFIEYPYTNSPQACVQYNDFLKTKHIFYSARGEPIFEAMHPTRLFFSKSILTYLNEKDFLESKPNDFVRRKMQLTRLLYENEVKIIDYYGKSFMELTRIQFRECLLCLLKQSDGQNLIDNLWQDIRIDRFY